MDELTVRKDGGGGKREGDRKGEKGKATRLCSLIYQNWTRSISRAFLDATNNRIREGTPAVSFKRVSFGRTPAFTVLHVELIEIHRTCVALNGFANNTDQRFA